MAPEQPHRPYHPPAPARARHRRRRRVDVDVDVDALDEHLPSLARLLEERAFAADDGPADHSDHARRHVRRRASTSAFV